MKGTYSNNYCHFLGGVAQPFLARGVEQADIVTLGEHWTIAFLKRFGPRVEVGWSSLMPQPWRSVYVHNVHPLWGSNWIWSDHVALPRPFFRFRIFRANLMQPAPKQDCCAAKMIPSSQQQGRGQGHQGWIDVFVCKTWSQPGFFLTLVDFDGFCMFEFDIDFEVLEVLSTSLERSKWFPSCLFLALRIQFDRTPSFPTNIPCQIQHASRCPDDRLDL